MCFVAFSAFLASRIWYTIARIAKLNLEGG